MTQTPGDWSGYGDLSVGDNYRNLLLQTNTPQGWVGGCTSGFPRRYEIRIVRASAFSGIGGVTTTAPPLNTPVNAGTTITATPINVTGVPAPTVTYDWEAAPAPTADFQVVATTTTPSWTPDNSVADQYIRVSATASNGVSIDAEARSLVFGPIAGVAEAPGISAVSISGTPRVGDSLTASVSATGYPTPTLAYSWLSAASAAGPFTAISGATGSNYTPTEADLGRVLKVSASASNTSGPSATLSSSATDAVLAAPAAGTGGSSGAGGTDGSGLTRVGVQPIDGVRPSGGFTRGTVAALEAGGPVPATLTQDLGTGHWLVNGSDFRVEVAVQGPAGPLPAGADLIAPQGGALGISGRGYLPGTIVTTFLIPEPGVGGVVDERPVLPLGTADVLSDGTVQLRSDIPQQTVSGSYVLQVNGITRGRTTRSVNLGMTIAPSTAVARAGSVTRAAFFRPGTDVLSSAGAAKLRALIASVPPGSADVRVTLSAVSVGRATVSGNRQLATDRARAILRFLAARGISGATSVTLVTSTTAKTPAGAVPARTLDGQPLTTVRLSFVATP